ncbi:MULTISPECIES: hypothetical protein [Rodentibacter]|uniref:hypothetical protein n=1 Tax=Rodentibacter TaxID=1960084 RepID=UPI0013F625FF|nr:MULTISPECIES: hypothetical protein [Rodentibacter]
MNNLTYQVIGYSQQKPIVLGSTENQSQALSLAEKALNDEVYQAVVIKKQGGNNG